MRYNQPFNVGVNNPRFRGVSSDGYLPALETGDEDETDQSELIKIKAENDKLLKMIRENIYKQPAVKPNVSNRRKYRNVL